MAELFLPLISESKCTVCGLCVDACPESVLGIRNSALVFVNPKACTYCGVCEETCPTGAVRLEYFIRWAKKGDQ